MRYLFGILILCTLAACQNEQAAANEVKLFANYYVRYLQNEQQLKAEASFKKGLEKENAKKIDLAGEIRLLNTPLIPININGSILRYQLEQKTKLKPNYEFVLEHDSGELSKHKIEISPIREFSLENGVASQSKGFQLNWEGANLSENDRLLIMITDQNDKAHSITINGPTSGQSAAIQGTDLLGLATGNGYIYLVKKSNQEEIQNKTVINSLAEYYTDRILVEIVE